jgi:hypothetical protein
MQPTGRWAWGRRARGPLGECHLAFSPASGSARDTLNAARDRSKRYRFGYWSEALESGILRSPSSDEASDGCFLRDATLHPKEYRLVRAPALALTAAYTMQNWFFYLDPVVAARSGGEPNIGSQGCCNLG